MRIINNKFLFFTQNECIYDIENKDHRNIIFYIIGYQESMECIIFCVEKGKKTRASTRDSWNKLQINRPSHCDEKNYFLQLLKVRWYSCLTYLQDELFSLFHA